MKNDIPYLKHIQEAIEKIEGYLNGLDYDSFLNNDMAFDAVVRELEIIGEAANNISQEFQENHPEIPWPKMIGIRNKLIHEYFGVNAETVWSTCKEDLPELKDAVSDLLAEN